MSRLEPSAALDFNKKAGNSMNWNQRDPKSVYCLSAGKWK